MDLEISGDIQLIPASSCLVWPKPWQLGKSAETPRAMLCAPKPWASAGIDSCTMLICSSSVHLLIIICSSSVHHLFIISSSSLHHLFIISSSYIHHLFIC
jgi:hypothetical protein